MKRLFGTDGIRGVAGQAPLDPSTIRRLGAALAATLDTISGRSIVLGRDTRESGPWLRDAVTGGLTAGGWSAVDVGVITTPGLAYVVREGGFAGGVMISASHNPYADNGLKVFGPDGMKLSDEVERRLEALILDGDGDASTVEDSAPVERPSLVRDYVTHLESVVGTPRRFEGLRVVLDCANGSACAIAPEVFRHHGATVHTIGTEPNGRNINLDCGSLHLDGLAAAVRESGADIGIAFDGDADRALAVDRRGREMDGDAILWVLSRRLQRTGALRGSGVVATIMSNLWLERRLADDGITLHRTAVGDKYVLEQMLSGGLALGGEQSGHVILLDHATTGDGILCALMLLDALLDEPETLETLLDRIEPCPQVLHNVRVTTKPDLRRHPKIGPEVERVEREMNGAGRVVLRYSGTEPVARVMVEGVEASAVQRHAADLARVIEEELGG